MNSDENNRPSAPPCPRLGYVPELDGTRGLAILLVMGNHLPFGQHRSLLPGGFVGVDLFFALSGFLITTLLVQEFDRTGSIRLGRFYLRRALRLGPALIAMLIAIGLSGFLIYDPGRAREIGFDALIALSYISNWYRIFSPNQLGLFAHTWSLSVEEQFYLLWPLILVLLLRRSTRRRSIIFMAAAATLLSWLVNVYLALHLAQWHRYIHLCFGLDSRGGALMIGCILGIILSSGLLNESARKILQKQLVILAPLSLVLLVAYAIFSGSIGRAFFYFGFAVVSLLAGILILDVQISPASRFKQLMRMKWLVWVGSVSYGLYLWHWPIFFGMSRFGCSGWTVLFIGGPLTFLFVLISYYRLEKPVLELKKRFTSDNATAAPSLPATTPSSAAASA